MSTIIVASDAPSVRSQVVGVLDEPGTDLIEVSEGSEVRAAVKNYEPDLVIADLQMGNMGAMAICMDLRLEASYGNLPHVPVLMLLDRRADVFLGRRAGAEGWLVKPLDAMRLRKAATALIGGGIYHDRSFEPVVTSVAVPPSAQPTSTVPAGGA